MFESVDPGFGFFQRHSRSSGKRSLIDDGTRIDALVDPMEFFAESTEAFFTTNDFFPFNRTQLHAADPETEQLVGRLWGVPSFNKP